VNGAFTSRFRSTCNSFGRRGYPDAILTVLPKPPRDDIPPTSRSTYPARLASRLHSPTSPPASRRRDHPGFQYLADGAIPLTPYPDGKCAAHRRKSSHSLSGPQCVGNGMMLDCGRFTSPCVGQLRGIGNERNTALLAISPPLRPRLVTSKGQGGKHGRDHSRGSSCLPRSPRNSNRRSASVRRAGYVALTPCPVQRAADVPRSLSRLHLTARARQSSRGRSLLHALNAYLTSTDPPCTMPTAGRPVIAETTILAETAPWRLVTQLPYSPGRSTFRCARASRTILGSLSQRFLTDTAQSAATARTDPLPFCDALRPSRLTDNRSISAALYPPVRDDPARASAPTLRFHHAPAQPRIRAWYRDMRQGMD